MQVVSRRRKSSPGRRTGPESDSVRRPNFEKSSNFGFGLSGSVSADRSQLRIVHLISVHGQLGESEKGQIRLFSEIIFDSIIVVLKTAYSLELGALLNYLFTQCHKLFCESFFRFQKLSLTWQLLSPSTLRRHTHKSRTTTSTTSLTSRVTSNFCFLNLEL